MNRAVVVSFALSILCLPSLALARAVQCKKSQKICVTQDSNLTIGEKVGIYNEENELEATATVTSISGDKRTLEIQERYGPISASSHAALLPSDGGEAEKENAKIVRLPTTARFGLSAGYAAVSSGAGVTGEELGLWGDYRLNANWLLTARMDFLLAGGSVRIFDGTDFRSPNESVFGLGLLGGVTYESKATRPFSLRFELGIGAMNVKSTLDGDASENDAYIDQTRFKNGMNFFARWGLTGFYNFQPWHVGFGIAESFVGQAIANILVFSAAYDLKF